MYFVFRFILKNSGEEAHSEQRYDSEIAARKRFYSVIAADIDNTEIAYELVQIVREDGIVIASQVFDNREA